jgi:hypothetical protein
MTALARLPAGVLACNKPIRQPSRASGQGEEQAEFRKRSKQNELADSSDCRTNATEKRERSYPESSAQPYRQGGRNSAENHRECENAWYDKKEFELVNTHGSRRRGTAGQKPRQHHQRRVDHRGGSSASG